MNFESIPIIELSILLTAGFLLGALLIGGLFMLAYLKASRENAELRGRLQTDEEMTLRFKDTAGEAVRDAHEAFLQLAEMRLKEAQKDGAHDLDKRQKSIENLVTPVHEKLKELHGMVEQSKGTDQALREELHKHARETAKLVGVLRDPSAQGMWGEYILEGVLEKSGLMKGVHYHTQMTMETDQGRRRPDAVIEMQDGFNIIIDAKAPLNDVVRHMSNDEMSEDDHKQLMHKLASQVREHVKALGKKGYWENLDSPDFTVMFLPSEHMYSMALRADPSLPDFAAAQNVIIASPTLLMSLLRVVSMSWRQVELAQNAIEISTVGQELYKRLLTFTSHIEKIGKGLQNAMGSYDSAIGSMERSVLPSARKFKELQSGLDKDLPEINEIEVKPRSLNLTSDDEDERKRA